MTAVLREEETITPLELFFDLVFVLALTQCTALMAFIPLAYELKLPALGTVAILAASLVALIVSETHVYGEARTRVRGELRHQHQPNGETT